AASAATPASSAMRRKRGRRRVFAEDGTRARAMGGEYSKACARGSPRRLGWPKLVAGAGRGPPADRAGHPGWTPSGRRRRNYTAKLGKFRHHRADRDEARLDPVAGGERVLLGERPGHDAHAGLEREPELGELVREPCRRGRRRAEHLAAQRALDGGA